MYCCLSRDLSVRCSMLKEMRLLRAPENKRTGIEIRPKVRCPDQTEAAIIPLVHDGSCTAHIKDGTAHVGTTASAVRSSAARPVHRPQPNPPRIGSLAHKPSLDAQILRRGEPKCEAG